MGRKKKFENRFEVIVETADRLFLQKGFEETTMDEIAKACELGKATIYAEFESKDALMNAVIVRYIQQAQQEMKVKINAAKGNYLQVLKDLMLERVLHAFDHANQHFHSLEALLACRQIARKTFLEHQEEEYRIIANLLEKAAMNGEISPGKNYFRLAKILKKGVAAFRPSNAFSHSREELEQDALDVINLLLAGLSGDHGV